ncbi:ABC transporter family substrate-binding protein [Microlunatus elymi]|uniref:ABC transporter family substrate-binding protein n=1 Tax=Microlunatus elymi TaxID=2596828 RepID=A0A516Q3P5_9ACTN|nr:ABC transporter family substrate-binding protein [Microlunatus elymi]QDP98038.1 ABC transporter family substrate-binding protein [Microlunatus elymi]
MRFGKKGLVAGVAAIALSLSLAACGGGSGDNNDQGSSDQSSAAQGSTKLLADYNPQPRDNIKDGGTVTMPIVEVSAQQNTFQADGSAYTNQIWTWYNPQMMFFSPEGKWSANPDYLTDVKDEQKDGNTVITYTINPKAKWNDGSPMTWETFKTTWQDNSGKNSKFIASSTDGYSQIKSVTKGTDDRQAVVTFDGPWAWWQGLFNTVLNPHVNTPDVYNTGYLNKMRPEWGAGPYTIDSADFKTGRVTFKQNPNWWGDKGKLDKVVFQQYEDTASINAFKNGEIDMVSVATKDRLAQVKSMSDITVHRASRLYNGVLELNAGTPILKDPKVRQAIMEGIDRKTVAKIRFNGLDYTEQPPGSFNLLPFQPGYKDAFTEAGYKYDTAAAGKLLDEAGWTKGSDGIREKDGKKLSFELPLTGDDPSIIAQGKAIQSMEKEIGVDMQIKQIASADFSKIFSGGQWDAFMLGFTSSDPFGVAYMCQLYCSTSTSLNKTQTGTPEMDKKIEALWKIADQTKQTEAGMNLEVEVFKQTWGMMPMFNGPTVVATKKGLANLTPEPYSGLDGFGVQPVQNFGWQK